MDFDLAAKRFARDHTKLKRDAESRQRGRKLEVPASARRLAEERDNQARLKIQERQAKQRELEHQARFFRDYERSLRTKSLAPRSPPRDHQPGGYTSSPASVGFQPTSIHGEGDKLALPPSVLEHLSSLAESSSPWTFRIGIPNPDYVFPSSPLIQAMKPRDGGESGAMAMDDGDDDYDAGGGSDSDDGEEDESAREARSAAYLDELRHKYLAYTHGTVVEFSQEEGQVGLPRTVASALLSQIKSRGDVPVRAKRTVDPASRAATESVGTEGMEIERINGKDNDDDEEKTAGHLAWGAFDIPDYPIEVTLVDLPKGKACTLLPTLHAIETGFYGLQDVKLVLEQSLVRTRATLSVGDLVHTWSRGVQYDLQVTAVVPSTYNAVVCINTDIEVDFAHQPAVDSRSSPHRKASPSHETPGGSSLCRRLVDSHPSSSTPEGRPGRHVVNLLPEPPAEQTEGICVVQVRLDRASAKRRFDVNKATVKDLYEFAESAFFVDRDASGSASFRLVTRFPRRVIERVAATTNDIQTLVSAGIATGHELLIVERI